MNSWSSFDNILLKFGIKSNIISITEYLTIFTLLQNLKCNLLERESYSQIYYGDYGVEDKLYMLLEDLKDYLGFAVAGNFANHLGEAGEADEFSVIKTEEKYSTSLLYEQA